jgi:hypothetical protein
MCDQISKLSSQIRNIIYESKKPVVIDEVKHSHSNQTAIIDKGSLSNIKPSVGAYQRQPKGFPVIYTDTRAHLEPDARDVFEIVKHERPFICRAIEIFGKKEVACYTPDTVIFEFIKEQILALEEAEDKLDEALQRKWGSVPPEERLTDAERALYKEISVRRHDIKNMLNPKETAQYQDPYTNQWSIEEMKPGLASQVLNKCSFIVKVKG